MLLMSRILYLPENIPVSERIRAVMEALPGMELPFLNPASLCGFEISRLV
jgi:hypothetical protein